MKRKSIIEQMEEGHKKGYGPNSVRMTKEQFKDLVLENNPDLSKEDVNRIIAKGNYKGIKITVI